MHSAASSQLGEDESRPAANTVQQFDLQRQKTMHGKYANKDAEVEDDFIEGLPIPEPRLSSAASVYQDKFDSGRQPIME